MNHSIKDTELKQLLKVSRILKEAYEIIDSINLTKYTKLAEENGKRRKNGKT